MTGVQTDAPQTRRARRAQPAKHLRTDIQGLRALAVGMVVLAHAGIPFAAGGFIGVDVFFVISGFLITSLLLREVQRSSTISIRGFYERRARRILPAGTVVLVVTVLYSALTFSADRVGSIAGDAIWSSVFLANVHYAVDGTDYFATGDPSPLQHFWSLAVEEQFYLIWPLLVLAIVVVVRRRAKYVPFTRLVAVAVTAIIIGSLAWSMIETAVSPSTAYFSTPARAYELAGGALVAALTAAGTQVPAWLTGPLRGGLGWAGFAGLIVMMVAWDERTQIPGILAGLVVLATAAVLISGIGDVRGAGRMLSVRPVRFIGDISYSLYLWHWPLLTLGLLSGWGHAARVIVLIAASVVLAALSYRFVELPFQRGRVRMPRRTGHLILWPVAAVTVIAVSVGATWQTQQQLQRRGTSSIRRRRLLPRKPPKTRRIHWRRCTRSCRRLSPMRMPGHRRRRHWIWPRRRTTSSRTRTPAWPGGVRPRRRSALRATRALCAPSCWWAIRTRVSGSRRSTGWGQSRASVWCRLSSRLATSTTSSSTSRRCRRRRATRSRSGRESRSRR